MPRALGRRRWTQHRRRQQQPEREQSSSMRGAGRVQRRVNFGSKRCRPGATSTGRTALLSPEPASSVTLLEASRARASRHREGTPRRRRGSPTMPPWQPFRPNSPNWPCAGRRVLGSTISVGADRSSPPPFGSAAQHEIAAHRDQHDDDHPRRHRIADLRVAAAVRLAGRTGSAPVPVRRTGGDRVRSRISGERVGEQQQQARRGGGGPASGRRRAASRSPPCSRGSPLPPAMTFCSPSMEGSTTRIISGIWKNR